MKIDTLKRRAEFLRVRGGGRWSGPAFVVEGKARAADVGHAGARFGFTVTRKIGNAVVRNRIRRRLRAVLQHVAEGANPDFDYVVIARPAAAVRTFDDLKSDMTRALARVAADRRETRTARR